VKKKNQSLSDFDPENLRLDQGSRSGVESTLTQRSKPHAATDRDTLIGCPLGWFDRVLPIVKGKVELALALLLYRERFLQRDSRGRRIRKADTVTLSNSQLNCRGLQRRAKYQILRRLEAAGIIKVDRNNKASPKVTFND
jgi:hypothetical protein